MASLLNRVVAVVLLIVLLSSCSDEPAEVVVGAESDAGADVADETDVEPSEEDSDTELISSGGSTTPSVAEDSAPVDITELTIEPLGDSMIGVGEWDVLRPPASDQDESECRDGLLLYTIDDEVVHIYDDLSFAGGIRLFPGPRGQDAFVLNCEESVERVLIQGSAVMPEAGYPNLLEFPLFGNGAPDAFFEFLGQWTWRGDVFTGAGITADGQEVYMFDTSTEAVRQWSDVVGERTTFEDPHWVDVVVPENWTVENEDGYLTMRSNDSLSRVQLQRRAADETPPIAEGDELLSSDEQMVWVASEGEVAATEWLFLTPDDGIRVVRRVPAEGDTMVEIEMFADPADSGALQDLPWAVLDLIEIWP